MDSNHRSPVKDQLVETVLFDFPAEARKRAIGGRRSQPRDLGGDLRRDHNLRDDNDRLGWGRRQAQNGGSPDGGPMVRILLPPAESPSLSPSCFRGSRTPAFRAAVRRWLGDRVGRDIQVFQDRANRRQHLCGAIFQYRSAADGVGANATPVPIKSGGSPGLIAVDRCGRTGLNQGPAQSADRARQAAGVSARGASLASDRAAAAHRGSPG
jgi:hypothetical protein